MIDGLSTASTPTLALPVLRVGAQAYWTAIAVWIGFGMAVYAVVWRVTALEALAAVFATVAGCMIGLLALYIR